MSYRFLPILLICLLFTSCFDEESYSNTKKGNFDALWKILDERYCFFEYKNVDWDEVHTRYAPLVDENMTNDAFFDVMASMLAELKDGHVNLTARHNSSRYHTWFEDYPYNFDANLLQRYYLGKSTEFNVAGGLKYKVLDDNVGYIYYNSFSDPFSDSNLDHILARLKSCEGIIIDVRNNGGGMLTNSEKLSSRFFEEKTLVGYMIHKKGKAHNDFSKPYEIYVKPPTNRIQYKGKVVVLANRRSYSATNDFVNAMKYAPNVTIMGDRTGGGGGLPFSSEIPNGWSVRFSASPRTNASLEQIEFGINPDIKVDMTDADVSGNRDTIIEKARDYIKNT